MPNRAETTTHRLINLERKRRGLRRVQWSGDMYKLAKSHSKKMAKAGRLFHTRRFALRGGENISGGKGHHSPKDFVRNWMGSPPHRAWLLDPRVKTAAVGISKSKHGTFAAWPFSDQPLHKPIKVKLFKFKVRRGGGVLRLPTKLILICASIFAIVLGAHGVWVYFSRLELLFGGEASKLFLELEVPIRLQAPIEWMSLKGLQSWFIPAVFIVIGLVIWYWQSRIDVGDIVNVPRWLRKLHLW
jgi:hypothetical protein